MTTYPQPKAAAGVSAEPRISFPRWWIEHVRDGLMAMDKLPSGPLGDWAFLFREMLTDALEEPTEPSRTLPSSDQCVAREAEGKAQAALAYLLDHVVYSDSYAVEGSSFKACHLCQGGGAPGVPMIHDDDCPVTRCEASAQEYWDDLRELSAENKELEAKVAALAVPQAAVAEDDRWPKAGDVMRFLDKNGYPFELEEARKLFCVGQLYTVRDCNVHNWSHDVQFNEVEGNFNGVMFERVDAALALTNPAPTELEGK